MAAPAMGFRAVPAGAARLSGATSGKDSEPGDRRSNAEDTVAWPPAARGMEAGKFAR